MAKPRPKIPEPSLELRTYLAAVAAHEASTYGHMVPGDRGYSEAEADNGRLVETRRAARLVIQNRPVSTWRDFVELAEVTRAELGQQAPDGSWVMHSFNYELEEAMQAAVWKLIDGGLHG